MYQQPYSQSNDTRGTVSLILGILGLLLFQPLGIGAIIMGNQVVRELPPSDAQYPLGNAGRILGWIAVALMCIGLMIVVGFVGFIVLAGAAGAH